MNIGIQILIIFNKRPLIFTLHWALQNDVADPDCRLCKGKSSALYFSASSLGLPLVGCSVREDKRDCPSSLPRLKCGIKPQLLLFTSHILWPPLVKISRWPFHLAHKYGRISKCAQKTVCVSALALTSEPRGIGQAPSPAWVSAFWPVEWGHGRHCHNWAEN